jgi:lysozyme
VTPSVNAADLLGAHAETLVEQFEGEILTPYRDTNGIWTNGYGNTHGVTAATPAITQAQAVSDLEHNLLTAENDILRLVTVPLNQNQFDGLTSFDYNIGSGHLQASSVLKKLNAGDYAGAADAMLEWDEAGGKPSAGLLRRRQAERALFLKPVAPSVPPATAV